MRILQQFASSHGPTWLADFASVDEQLRFLRRKVTEYRQEPRIRDLAVRVIKEAGAVPKDTRAQAIAIASWVQDNIYYVREFPERFALPFETLRALAGDCDDGTMLMGAMLESIGIQSFLIAMRIDGALSHIFPAAYIPSTRAFLPLDWTMNFPVSNLTNPCEYAKSKGKTVTLKIV